MSIKLSMVWGKCCILLKEWLGGGGGGDMGETHIKCIMYIKSWSYLFQRLVWNLSNCLRDTETCQIEITWFGAVNKSNWSQLTLCYYSIVRGQFGLVGLLAHIQLNLFPEK